MRSGPLMLLLCLQFIMSCEGEPNLARGAGDPCALSEECEANLCYDAVCLDPAADEDGDGLTNATEVDLGTMVMLPDSDGDGATDSEEIAGRLDAPPDGDDDGKIDALESFLVISSVDGQSEDDGDCVAPQYDKEDGVDNSADMLLELTCCCDASCDKEGIVVASYTCEDGVPVCRFSVLDDTDQDGLLPECDDDDDGDGLLDADDCAPMDPERGAAGEEVCDGDDNDCDGQIDEALGETSCGLGQCAKLVSSCSDGVVQSCDPMAGATEENCDAVDNDCDGAIDEDWSDVLGVPCLTAHEDCGGVAYFTCSPESGELACPKQPAPLGTLCDDGNPETFADQCDDAGNCTGVSCTHADSCTSTNIVDGACVYTANPDTCFIEHTCYDADEPHPQYPCKRCHPETSSDSWSYLSEGSSCDDEDVCSEGDACTAQGACVGSPVVCEDAHGCTEDTCTPGVGCVFTPQDSLCDDGVACTTDACSLIEGCVVTLDDAMCDLGDSCWTSKCDPTLGCQDTWLALDGCLYDCSVTSSLLGTSPAADGGTTGNMVFAGDHAYVFQQTSGAQEFTIIDATDATNPQPLTLFSLVSQTWGKGTDLLNVSLPRRGFINDEEGPLYIASSAGFHVVDVSDPSDPIVIANHGNTLGQLYGMTQHPIEPVIYGAIESGAVISIDVSTPSNPSSQIDSAQLSVETFDVAMGLGNRLFLAGYDLSLQSFDVLTPLAPSFISAVPGIDAPTNLAESVIAVQGDLAVVASNRDGYRLIDVSDGAEMTVLYESGSPGKIYDVAFFEGYLLLASKNQGVVIVDIAIPTVPEEVATIEIGGTPRGVHVVGHRVFVSTSSHFLKVIDLTLPCTDDNFCTLDACHVEDGCNFDSDVNCDDLDPCTLDGCNPATGCSFEVIPNCVLGEVGAP